MQDHTEHMAAVIDHMESHLFQKLDLETVADAVHYSKYYLHRIFMKETGLTIHDYVQRRRLTEAAKLLVFSKKPIIEIALLAGYESQQAFTAVFKEMYKKTPNQYRREETFYPLQLRYRLYSHPVRCGGADYWKQRIIFAEPADVPQWMELVHLVIDGFPYLDAKKYQVQLKDAIDRRRALIVKDADRAVGVMAFQKETGSIDFLGVHPQYRRQGIAGAFLRRLNEELAGESACITITTFREGDKADTGSRYALKRLGFAEAELLVEYGYPTQRLVWKKEGAGKGT